MASYYTSDYKNTAELLGLDSKSSVKKIQQQLLDAGYNLGSAGVDGVWGPATDAAYWQYTTPSTSGSSVGSSGLGSSLMDMLTGKTQQKTEDEKKAEAVAEMDAGIKKYFDQVLGNYNLPTRSEDEIRAQIEAILNPSYQAAVKQRKDTTAANRGAIDLDAYSRGMGASTWDTDAKQRESIAEASDLASLAGQYQSALAQSILDQLNQDQANRLTATNNAYSLALQLYQMAKAEEEAAASDILSTLGSGGSSVSTYDLLTGGGSSSGKSSSSSSSTATPSGLKAAYTTAAAQAAANTAKNPNAGKVSSGKNFENKYNALY